jgi:hypothetical protein
MAEEVVLVLWRLVRQALRKAQQHHKRRRLGTPHAWAGRPASAPRRRGADRGEKLTRSLCQEQRTG